MRISAVIVDDEPLARRRIRSLLAREPDVDVVKSVAMEPTPWMQFDDVSRTWCFSTCRCRR
jgi:DNA-binding NarL/FixJ family response regulator